MVEKIRKLQGKVTDIEKTDESMTDEEGNRWEKCIFTVELTNFSKRTLDETEAVLSGKQTRTVYW